MNLLEKLMSIINKQKQAILFSQKDKEIIREISQCNNSYYKTKVLDVLQCELSDWSYDISKYMIKDKNRLIAEKSISVIQEFKRLEDFLNLFEQYQKDEFINYELIEAIGYIGIMRQLDDDIIEKRMKEILQNLEKKGYAKYRIYDYLFYITKNEKYLDAILNGLQSWDDDIRYQALYTVEDVIINEDDNKWLKKINKKLIDNIEKDKRYNRIYRERLINRIRERMGKKKIIAETGAGQHGVATATVAAKFKMECKIFMGEEDIRRQALNVKKMELLGATVISVSSGNGTLKDSVNEAIRYWVSNVEDTYYVMGTVAGPHPYPIMVRVFQRIIGDEAKKQILEKEGRLPDCIIAPVGGGSNSIGIFYPFIDDEEVELIGIEGAGRGIETGKHAAAIHDKNIGGIHGMMTYVLKDDDGQIKEAYSISAGLDYPAVGPEHAYLDSIERAKYDSVKDEEAIDAFLYLTKIEGIVPALESSHAIAYAKKVAGKMSKDKIIIINISGRGDKDMDTVVKYLEERYE